MTWPPDPDPWELTSGGLSHRFFSRRKNALEKTKTESVCHISAAVFLIAQNHFWIEKIMLISLWIQKRCFVCQRNFCFEITNHKENLMHWVGWGSGAKTWGRPVNFPMPNPMSTTTARTTWSSPIELPTHSSLMLLHSQPRMSLIVKPVQIRCTQLEKSIKLRVTVYGFHMACVIPFKQKNNWENIGSALHPRLVFPVLLQDVCNELCLFLSKCWCWHCEQHCATELIWNSSQSASTLYCTWQCVVDGIVWHKEPSLWGLGFI